MATEASGANGTDEAWRPIEDRYEVSNLGRVRSIKSKAARGPGDLVGSKNRAGYKYVRLSRDDGSSSLIAVHQLVLAAFRGVEPSLAGRQGNTLVPDHINEDKSDNRLSNLEWVTPGENMRRRQRNERIRK